MKIKIIILFVLIGSVISCSEKYNIKANISGLGNDTIYVRSFEILKGLNSEPILDTIIAKNGEFTYNSPTIDPLFCIISPKKGQLKLLNQSRQNSWEKSIMVLIRPQDKIKINGKLEKYYLDYNARGSSFNEGHSSFRKKYASFSKSIVKNELKLDSASFNNESREKINTFYINRKELRGKENKIKLEFIKNNLDKEITAYYLIKQPLDTIGKYFHKLDKSVQKGIFQNTLKYQLTQFQKYTKVQEAEIRIKIGEKAPKFALKSINGENFSVDFSKSKYIVFDFWGSWCAPCISGFPKMKEYFEKYNTQIDFIGIACNDTEEKWKNTVEKYDLKWENLINNNHINKDVSVMYSVKAYPTKIIINSNGIIEGIFNGEGDDFYKKLDDLMVN